MSHNAKSTFGLDSSEPVKLRKKCNFFPPINYIVRKTGWRLAWESYFRNETFLCTIDRQAWFWTEQKWSLLQTTQTLCEEKFYLFHVTPGSATLFLCLNLRFIHLQNIRIDEKKNFLKINKSTYSLCLVTFLITKRHKTSVQIYKRAVNVLFTYNLCIHTHFLNFNSLVQH